MFQKCVEHVLQASVYQEQHKNCRCKERLTLPLLKPDFYQYKWQQAHDISLI